MEFKVWVSPVNDAYLFIGVKDIPVRCGDTVIIKTKPKTKDVKLLCALNHCSDNNDYNGACGRCWVYTHMTSNFCAHIGCNWFKPTLRLVRPEELLEEL